MDEKGKNIIIDFTEKEESIYKPPGNLAQLQVSGVASVINPSEQHRLWNIALQLKGLEMVTSDLTPDVKVGELSPKGQWTGGYEVKADEIQTKTSLKLTERIDTYYEKGVEVNWALVKDHQMPVSFTISLENTTSNSITQIKLTKHIPEAFGNPLIDTPDQGTARFDEASRILTWDDFNLVSGGVQSLIIRIGFRPETTEPFPTGDINVDYIVPNLIRSKMTGMTNSHSDSMFAIDQGESLDEPGEWECTAEFENISDFAVQLNDVAVEQVLEGRKETVVEEAPSIQLEPDNRWSKDFTVKSGVVPKFSSVHNFNVVPKVMTKIVGHIKYEADVLPVAYIEAEKIIDPPSVSAYTKTPIKISLVLTNAGSAVLNEAVFRDTIPADHVPPDLNDVLAYIGEDEIRSGIAREMDPLDTNPEIKHTLIVKLEDLKPMGGFQPGDQILVTYPLKSWEPKPKVEYACPLDITANVSPPGPPVKIPTLQAEVEVKYVRRRISARKGQTPGEGEGEFIIPIIFENKGEVLIENITLKDIVPPNFQLLDWNPKEFSPATEDTARGTVLTWKIDKADPGQRIKFSYTIRGTGDYEREELEVIVG
jgi:hypothetical protein